MENLTIEIKGLYKLEDISFKEIRLAVNDYCLKHEVPERIYLSHNDAVKLSQMCNGNVLQLGAVCVGLREGNCAKVLLVVCNL